jgi:hypothetical protein
MARPILAVLETGEQDTIGPAFGEGLNCPLADGDASPSSPSVVSGYADWKTLLNQAQSALPGATIPGNVQALSSMASIAAAALPVPVVGEIVAAVAAVVGAFLSIFGIKQPTQHVPSTDAANSARNFWNASMLPVINSAGALSSDAFQQLWKCFQNFDGHMVDVFSSWWDGAAVKYGPPHDLRTVDLTGLSQADIVNGYMYEAIYFWFWLVTSQADAETVQQNMHDWYFANIEAYITKPMDAWYRTKYNESLDQVVNDKGIKGSSIPGLSSAGGTSWAPAAAGVGILALLLAGSKMRKAS